MKIPAAFLEDRFPPILTNNFRKDTWEVIMRILYIAERNDNPDVPEGFTISDCREYIFEKTYRLNYLIKRLEEVGLIKSTGFAETMPGTPRVYVITDLYRETIGSIFDYIAEGAFPVEKAEDSASNKGYTTVFRNSYSGTNININLLMSVFDRQTQTTQKSRALGGMIGLLGIQGEYETAVLDTKKAKFWIEDYIEYLENMVKILHQLMQSPYFRVHGGDEIRSEIWTPLRKDGSVLMREDESGLTMQEFFEAIDYFLHDRKAHEVFGGMSMDMIATLVKNMRGKLDSGEDVA